MIAFVRLIARCTRGTAVIETALVAPVLALMVVGIFETGTMVQKQQELQSAANESEAIILASSAGSGVTSTQLKSMLVASTGLPAANIQLAAKWRCNNAATMVSDPASCTSGQRAYQFVQATFTSRYTPTWTKFGLGGAFDYSVVRTVQVG